MINKDCRRSRERLAEYLDNTLDTTEHAAVQSHLATCKDCAAELETQRAVHAGLNALKVPDPGAAFWDAFPDQVLKACRAEQATKPDLGARLRRTLGDWLEALQPRVLMPVAAALVLAVGLAVFITREPETPPALAFQTQIVTGRNLAVLARDGAAAPADAAQYGFAAGTAGTNFFRAGHAYAEALAYSAGGDFVTTRARLATVAGIARRSGSTGEKLAARTEALAARATIRPLDLGRLESGLAQLAEQRSARDRALYDSGVWLVNTRLALVAGDSTAMQAAARELAQQLPRFETAGLAPGAIRGLRDLALLLAHEQLAAREIEAARALVRDIETILL